MELKPTSKSSEQEALVQKKQNIPVHVSDLAAFDNTFVSMSERFKEEMKNIDQQMSKFRMVEASTSPSVTHFIKAALWGLQVKSEQVTSSSDLMQLFGETVQTTVGSTNVQDPESIKADWDLIKNSPLVIGEGDDKCLRLQFDVSQFDPTEIQVRIINQTLIVTASHEEKSADSAVFREYNRQFKLPPGIVPEQVTSTLSRDGVLTVQAPFTIPRQDSLSLISGD